MATLQERYDAACTKLEAAANAVRHGDKSVNYDLVVLERERNRLADELAATQSSPQSTRTLLELEDA